MATVWGELATAMRSRSAASTAGPRRRRARPRRPPVDLTTTSIGRLFDAVAVLLGRRTSVSYEAQAAIELEWSARAAPGDGVDLAAWPTSCPSRRRRRPRPRPRRARGPPRRRAPGGYRVAALSAGFHEAIGRAAVRSPPTSPPARARHGRPHRRRLPEHLPQRGGRVRSRGGGAAGPRARPCRRTTVGSASARRRSPGPTAPVRRGSMRDSMYSTTPVTSRRRPSWIPSRPGTRSRGTLVGRAHHRRRDCRRPRMLTGRRGSSSPTNLPPRCGSSHAHVAHGAGRVVSAPGRTCTSISASTRRASLVGAITPRRTPRGRGRRRPPPARTRGPTAGTISSSSRPALRK